MNVKTSALFQPRVNNLAGASVILMFFIVIDLYINCLVLVKVLVSETKEFVPYRTKDRLPQRSFGFYYNKVHSLLPTVFIFQEKRLHVSEEIHEFPG